MTTPLLYEVHTRQWLSALTEQAGRAVSLKTVPDDALDALVASGVTHLWLMGVWPTGPLSRAQALASADLRRAYDAALPAWTDDDVTGSPYAVASHSVAEDLGGDAGLAHLRARLAKRGVRVVLDFVPNHVGLDHPWVAQHPELFVHGETPMPESFRIGGGPFIAHGKDPFFSAWTDVAQVDYRRADARRAMSDMLASIAQRCDGVRCDMAMLVLDDVFRRTWAHAEPTAPAATGEFWTDAIARVRAQHPDFLFLAEAYWDKEPRLLELGFDAAYDKRLLDALVHRRFPDATAHLTTSSWVDRAVHFLENHDESRVAPLLSLPEHRAAAFLILTLPGVRFLNDGQLEGARVRPPIQLRRRAPFDADADVAALYTWLLGVLTTSAVGRGRGALLRPSQAWEENPTHAWFVVVLWPDGPDAFELAVLNTAPHRCQCRVRIEGAAGGTWSLADRLSTEQWTRDGDELAGPGLFLDVDGLATQLFRFTRV